MFNLGLSCALLCTCRLEFSQWPRRAQVHISGNLSVCDSFCSEGLQKCSPCGFIKLLRLLLEGIRVQGAVQISFPGMQCGNCLQAESLQCSRVPSFCNFSQRLRPVQPVFQGLKIVNYILSTFLVVYCGNVVLDSYIFTARTGMPWCLFHFTAYSQSVFLDSPSFRDSFKESVVGTFSESLNSEEFVVLKFEMVWLLNLWVQSCVSLKLFSSGLFPSI